MKKFGEVKIFLNDIPNINMGGCGIAALAMYRWLKKNDNDKYYFTYLYTNDAKHLYEINNDILNNNRNGNKFCAASHVVLRDPKRNMYIDTDSKVKFSKTLIPNVVFEQNIYDENLIVESLNQMHWNYIFKRYKYINKIEKELDIDLSDIDLFNDKYLIKLKRKIFLFERKIHKIFGGLNKIPYLCV